ncbi:MAG TPA: hypothetical protein VGF86_01535 [Candidatus Tumulicola sp.]
MKRTVFALVGALFAASALPAFAASSLEVPTAATAPSVDPRADSTTFDPAAVAQLSWDSTSSKAAPEDTTARVSTDGKFLYVRFDATQSERIVSAQPADGRNGDLVWVELQPGGSSATTYRFASSPDGSGAASASSGTAPVFSSSGSTFDGGYTVTMKIPLAGLQSVPSGGTWNVQFGRAIVTSGTQLVWSHDGNVAQAGTMTMPASVGSTGSAPQ